MSNWSIGDENEPAEFATIADSIGNLPGITAGEMSMRPMANGEGFWLESEAGTGTQVPDSMVERVLADLFAEVM